MKRYITCPIAFRMTLCAAIAIACATSPSELLAQSSESGAEAFIEPYRSIKIPATEIGTITLLSVDEGAQVSKGQELARLDDRILQASLAAAAAAKNARGNLRAAEAELRMKDRQLQSLHLLRSRGNATQRELDRALADRELSEARLQAVREDLEVRKLEADRIMAQIDKRVLRSPIDGVVTEIQKQAGEFVAPTDPIVMMVVQLDPVVASFSIDIAAAQSIKQGDRVHLTVGQQMKPVQGTIEFKSPTADPKSGTVKVKVMIPNGDRAILSGSTCYWDISGQSINGFTQHAKRQPQVSRNYVPVGSRR